MAFISLEGWARRGRDWLTDEALPFWATIGFDRRTGGFHERCSFDGKPIDAAARRLMVQARQIYVFSHAHLLGWHPDARELAARGVEHLVARYRNADGRPGFVFSLTPSGRVADGKRDTYGHAFVLMALGWYARATGDTQAISIARETVEFIDATLSDVHGAFVDAQPRSDLLKRQNPHMHLFEGFLALYGGTGDVSFLKRAEHLHDLCLHRLFRSETGILAEYFRDDWTALPGETGRIWEPGHHFEWAWLLHLFADAANRPVAPEALSLIERATAEGFNTDGRIYDELLDDGSVLKNSTRAWPLTEATKAGVARAEHGDVVGRHLAKRALVSLFTTFLGQPWRAGWTDHVTAEGAPIVDYAPASTLYHAFLAIAEANRLVDGLPFWKPSDK